MSEAFEEQETMKLHYNGQVYFVNVLPNGFQVQAKGIDRVVKREWDHHVYSSPSAQIAEAIIAEDNRLHFRDEPPTNVQENTQAFLDQRARWN